MQARADVGGTGAGAGVGTGIGTEIVAVAVAVAVTVASPHDNEAKRHATANVQHRTDDLQPELRLDSSLASKGWRPLLPLLVAWTGRLCALFECNCAAGKLTFYEAKNKGKLESKLNRGYHAYTAPTPACNSARQGAGRGEGGGAGNTTIKHLPAKAAEQWENWEFGSIY